MPIACVLPPATEDARNKPNGHLEQAGLRVLFMEPKRPAVSAEAKYGEHNDEEIPRGPELGEPEEISVWETDENGTMMN